MHAGSPPMHAHHAAHLLMVACQWNRSSPAGPAEQLLGGSCTAHQTDRPRTGDAGARGCKREFANGCCLLLLCVRERAVRSVRRGMDPGMTEDAGHTGWSCERARNMAPMSRPTAPGIAKSVPSGGPPTPSESCATASTKATVDHASVWPHGPCMLPVGWPRRGTVHLPL